MPNARARIVASLKGQSHIRPDMLNPDYRWRLNVDEARAAKDSIAFCDSDSDGYFIKVEGDSQLRVPLEFCRIGTNFQSMDGQVHLIGLDFDGLNHGDGHTPEQLTRIINAIKRVEWCHIHRSRSGRGYHVFIPLGRPIFADLNDGAVMALGNRMVQILAHEISEPGLADFVCKAGSVMYLAAPEAGPDGFQLIKAAVTVYPGDVQPLYRAGKFQGEPATLNDEHRQFIDHLKANAQCDVRQDGQFWWAHTKDIENAHRALGLRGTFHTASTTHIEGTANAWMIPQENGQWLIGRRGKHEPSWPTFNGYSYCVLNPFIDFEEFSEVVGGNHWTMEEAQQFCAQLGQTFPDPGTNPASIVVARTKDGITFTIPVKPTQSLAAGWRKISDRKAQFFISSPTKAADPQESVRVCFNRGGKATMIYRRLHGDYWHQVSTDDAKMFLESWLSMTPPEIGRILTTDRPIELVNEPFADEWIGSYKWNHNAVQLAFTVGEPGEYPHWQMILDHIGRGLDDAVKANEWCQANGIDSGARYLMYWDARVIRAPLSRLPMLCLYSPQQNCGKSIQFSKFQLLITKSGYTLAENALKTDFSLELKNAIVCDLDDVDLSPQAAKKLLPFLTNDTIRIVGKGRDSIQLDNSTHWGHSANHLNCFWIPSQDKRTVAIEVGVLTSEVPRESMDRHLLAEAPYYLRALFDLPMPEPASRLYLPVLDTPLKRRIMAETSPTTGEQAAWVRRLETLADSGKLQLFTADDLIKLWPEAPDCHALRSNWDKLSTLLESDGYRTNRVQDKSGNRPTTYSITL